MQETPLPAMHDVLERQRADYLREGAVPASRRIDRIDRAIALLVDDRDRLVDAMMADFGHISRSICSVQRRASSISRSVSSA